MNTAINLGATTTIARPTSDQVPQKAHNVTTGSNGTANKSSTGEFANWARMVFGRLSRQFEHGDGVALLRWAIETFGTGLSIGTGFGASGIVMMDLALRIYPDVDIFYIDTGYFFPETEQLIQRLEHHYQRNLRRVATETSIEQQEKRYGPKLYANDPNLCCHIRKVTPLQKALADSTAWVTALRHDQANTRKAVPMAQWNERYNLLKLSPMVHWTEDDIWEYIHEHRLPYNLLHDQSYPSIGCWPCTQPVAAGEDIRAGRWKGQNKTECGLHWEINTERSLNSAKL